MLRREIEILPIFRLFVTKELGRKEFLPLKALMAS
jgi:hypothetical protein